MANKITQTGKLLCILTLALTLPHHTNTMKKLMTKLGDVFPKMLFFFPNNPNPEKEMSQLIKKIFLELKGSELRLCDPPIIYVESSTPEKEKERLQELQEQISQKAQNKTGLQDLSMDERIEIANNVIEKYGWEDMTSDIIPFIENAWEDANEKNWEEEKDIEV